MAPIAVPKFAIAVDCAQQMVDVARKHAESLGKQVSIAVCDESGFLVAFARMDDANPSSVKIALDKAYTAATTRIATHKWFEIVTTDEQLKVGAAVGVERMIVFGGGQPIVHEGAVIGAIGVSGGHWTGDTEIGTVALDAVGARGPE
ncbi:GlcG/HbpS family heme-binding protein [Pseudonocardia pini]|uniref:GlcG/HbpS family heme-binding protein n=1 Tax=Pseudonocardia pini TaxID=2758030 RepID=UPI0015F0FE54|nr:heme-binding protein [Pseudonocardia pini]